MCPTASAMIFTALDAHLASADSEENCAPALGNGVVVLLHDAVKGLASAMGLAHQGLRLLELGPDACGLRMQDKTSPRVQPSALAQWRSIVKLCARLCMCDVARTPGYLYLQTFPPACNDVLTYIMTLWQALFRF